LGFTPTDTIWFNGRLVPWPEAKVHVLAHGLHYGTGVFEGMRCYQTADGPAVFRLDAHLERFFQSAAIYELPIPYTIPALAEATLELVRANRLDNAYLRPIAFFDASTLSVWTRDSPVTVAIAGFPSGAYLAGGPDRGVRVTISPVRKFPSNAMPASAKACGQYINSARAVNEALRRGFDEAILLNQRGEVSEGSGENIFLVKGGGIHTNDIDADILMGVTRDTTLQVARDLQIPVKVAPIRVEDLLAADELFFSGTAVEVTPIGEVDGTRIGDGNPGPITRRIQETFYQAVRGQRPEYRKWLAFANQPVRAYSPITS
jgi:branched-chain amino acid aminotransferase